MAPLPHEIYAVLLRGILTGSWGPQSRLPPERKLAALHATNRNTLREAIRRLEQSRLVTVRQGQGATVQCFREMGSLELLPPFIRYGQDDAEKARVLLDLAAARRPLLSHVVTVACERRRDADLQALRLAAEEVRAAELEDDAAALSEAQLGWNSALLASAHSLGLRWLLNPLLRATKTVAQLRPQTLLREPSFGDMAEAVGQAIEERDKEKARRLIDTFYTEVEDRLSELFGAAAKRPDDAARASS